MPGKRQVTPKVSRAKVLATAGLAALLLYTARTFHPHRRTPVGVEQYLFHLPPGYVGLIEGPRGTGWILLRAPSPYWRDRMHGLPATVGWTGSEL